MLVDFEVFRGPLVAAALRRSAHGKGGQPPYDPVAMLKVQVQPAQNNVGHARWNVRSVIG